VKSKSVATVTDNDTFVRLRIFDGDLPIDDAAAALIRLEREQHTAERQRHSATFESLCAVRRELRELKASVEAAK
jgi:hypothetical protein